MTPDRPGGAGLPEAPLARMIDALTAGDSPARLKAAKALGHLGPAAGAAVSVLVGSLDDRSILVRVGVAEALGRIGAGATSAVPALIVATRDKYATVRETAADALGRIGRGAEAAIGPLCQLLRDGDQYVQSAAVRALGLIGPASVPALMDILAEEAPDARAVASDALAAIGSEARPALSLLSRLVEDSDPAVRLSAAAAVWGLTRDPGVLSPLAESLDDQDESVRSRAARLLDRLGPGAREALATSGRPFESDLGTPGSVGRVASPSPSFAEPRDEGVSMPLAREGWDDGDEADPPVLRSASLRPGAKSGRHGDFVEVGSPDRGGGPSPSWSGPPAVRETRPNVIRISSVPAHEADAARIRPLSRVVLVLASFALGGILVAAAVRWSSYPPIVALESSEFPGHEDDPRRDPTPGATTSIRHRLPDGPPAPVVRGVPPGRPEFPPGTVTNSVRMKLVPIAPGVFAMGSAGSVDSHDMPEHPVTLTRPFLLGAFEVTQAEWQEVMQGGLNPSWFSGDAEGSGRKKVAHLDTGRHPVEQVTWFDAVRFCNRLSVAERLAPYYVIDGEAVSVPDPAGLGYRLPTEAEWEYACRADAAATPHASGPTDLDALAWHAKNSGEQTHSVGGKSPNSRGLHDMLGNVAEWCWDWDGAYGTTAATDPVGPDSGKYRALRGGAWDSYPVDLGDARRAALRPSERHKDLGFRVARDMPRP